MTDTSTMVCPVCNIEMNCHARKIVEPRTAEERARMDPDLGGSLLEVHCCPGCGASRARTAGS